MPEEAPPTVVAIVGPSGVSSNVQPDVQSRIAILTSTLFFKSTGRQDNTSQIFDPSVYQADLELTARPAYCGHH
jgi:hypothetical protein